MTLRVVPEGLASASVGESGVSYAAAPRTYGGF